MIEPRNALSLIRVAVLAAGWVVAAPAEAALRYHWADSFSDAERTRITTWLDATQAALEKLVGAMPFDVQIFVHRRANAGEPVPWAHTEREDEPGVVVYVDPSYSLEDFRADWTAPHELSHLVLPWLGDENSWFAEGFASYMQYQVMLEMGVISDTEAAARYRERLDTNRRGYAFPKLPFTQAAPRLRAKREYPAMYWGGAVYFLRADAQLRAKGTSLLAVLKTYLACCHQDDAGLEELVAALDKVAKGTVFTGLLKEFNTEPGFPRLDNP